MIKKRYWNIVCLEVHVYHARDIPIGVQVLQVHARAFVELSCINVIGSGNQVEFIFTIWAKNKSIGIHIKNQDRN